MGIESTSNLVSLENEKITACNFQIMVMNSSVMPHDLIRGQIGSYAYMQIRSYSKFHDDRSVKSTISNTYTQNT